MEHYSYPLYDVDNIKNPFDAQKDFYDFVVKHSEEMSVFYTGNKDSKFSFLRRICIHHILKAVDFELEGDLRLKNIVVNFLENDRKFEFYKFDSIYARAYFNKTLELPKGFSVSNRKLLERKEFINHKFIEEFDFIYVPRVEDVYNLYASENMISYLLTSLESYKTHLSNTPEYKGSPIFDIVTKHINDNSILRPICAEVLDLLNDDMIIVLCGRLQEYSNVIQNIELNEQAFIFLSFLKKAYEPVIDDYDTNLNEIECFSILKNKLNFLEVKYPELLSKINTIFELYGDIDLAMYDVLIGIISKDLDTMPTSLEF